MIDSKQYTLDSKISKLLPWYVTNSLSANEKAKVDAFLSTHPEYANEIELLQNIKYATEEEVDIPAPDTTRLMQKLNKIEQINEHSLTHKLHQIFTWLFSLKFALTAVPAALAFAVILFWAPSQTSHNGDFHTLSSADNPSPLTISVTTSATQETAAFIARIQKFAPAAKIRAESDNQFIIIVTDTLTPAESLDLLQNIQSLPAVKSAELVTTR